MTISSIDPTRGSVAGGTRVTITGSGFDLDGREGAVAVYFGSTAAQCESYYQTDRQLVCYTPPSTDLSAGWQQISVTGVAVDRGIQAKCKAGNCRFFYDSNYRRTPHLRDTTLGGSAGDIYTYSGQLQTSDFELHTARVGGFNCDITEELNPEETAIQSYPGDYGTIHCQLPGEIQPGRHNVSMQTSGEGGSPVLYRRTKQVDPVTGEVWHFTSHPTVLGVSSSVTGTEGGARITITGTNFAREAASNEVTLAGRPCEVVEAAFDGTSITCLTSPADDLLRNATDSQATARSIVTRQAAPASELVPGGRGWVRRTYSNYRFREQDLLNDPPAATETGQLALVPQAASLNHQGHEWEGLFEAPFDGWYTFKITQADDDAWLFLSDNESPDGLELVANMPWVSRDQFRHPAQRAAPVHLSRGERRFCRARAWEYGGDEYASFGVEVDIDEGVPVHPTALAHRGVKEVQEIKLTTTVNREKQRIEVRGPEDAKWKLKLLGSDGEEYSPAGELSMGAGWRDVYNSYRSARDGDNQHPVGCFSISVSREELSANASMGLPAGFRYDITINCATSSSWRTVRPAAAGGTTGLQVFPDAKGSRDGVLQSASEPLSGTFTIAIGDTVSAPIDYDAGNYDVEQVLLSVPGIDRVVVGRYGSTLDGAAWRITYLEPHGANVPHPMVDGSGLLTGTDKGVEASTLRNGSATAIDFDPIPADFMVSQLDIPLRHRRGGEIGNGTKSVAAASGSPERSGVHLGPVMVRSNGVRGSCQGHGMVINETTGTVTNGAGCMFAYDTMLTPRVSSANLMGGVSTAAPGSQLEILGSGFVPLARGAGLQPERAHTSSVTVGQAQCTITEATTTRILCTMGGGAAGNYLPIVTIGRGRGRALISESMNPLVIETYVAAVTPSSGSVAGGAILEISGAGFASLDQDQPSTDAEQQVAVGGKVCTVLEARADRIVCVAPALPEVDGQAVNVSVNGVVLANSYTPSLAKSPSITVMSPSALSAAQTGSITLLLDSMPQGVNAANVSISFGSRECRVLSLDGNSGEVVCELLRAEPLPLPQSPLEPLVFIENWGVARLNLTTPGGGLDTGFRVLGLSAAGGSLLGGAELTISGRGFSAIPSENSVFIRSNASDGTTVSVPCHVARSTAESIECTTGSILAMLPSAADDESATVGNVVVSRNSIEAVSACGTGQSAGSCEYSFQPNLTPQVHQIDFNATSRRLTITGRGFTDDGTTTVAVGSQDCPVLDDSRANESPSVIVCETQPGRAGLHIVAVIIEGVGKANSSALHPPSVVYELSVGSITPTTGSSQGGQRIEIHGSGFGSGADAEQMLVEFVGSELGTPVTKTATILRQGADSPSHNRLVVISPGFTNAPGVVHSSIRVKVLPAGSVSSSADMLEATLSSAHSTSVVDTAYTPQLDSISPATGQIGTEVVLSGSGFGAQRANSSFVAVGGDECRATDWSDDSITCVLGSVRAGEQKPEVSIAGKGLAFPTDIVTFVGEGELTSMDGATTGFGGGSEITVHGRGFPTVVALEASAAYENRDSAIAAGLPGGDFVEHLPAVEVCGAECLVTTSSYSELSCSLPPLVNAQALTSFNAESARVFSVLGPNADAELYQTSMSSAENALDSDVATTATSSSSQCFVGMDFGEGREAVLTRFAWYPDFWRAADSRGAVVEGSSDGSVWDTLATVDQMTILEGWNHIDILNGPEGRQSSDFGSEDGYRYLRYRAESGKCRINELEFHGVTRSTSDGTCNVAISLPAGSAGTSRLVQDTTSLGTIQYQASVTPTYHRISPKYGSALGGELVTIQGQNFGVQVQASDVNVSLNGVPCEVQSATDTTVVCTAGSRDRIREPSVSILVKGRGGAVGNSTVYFRYLDRWSSRTTWAGNEPPVEGDTIIIPEGQAVLLDVSPPRLFLILVQGELVFDRQDDLHLQATYIWVHGGHFQIGEEDAPFLQRAQVTLHGDRWRDIELPGIGAKTLSVSDRATRNEIVPHRQRAILEVHGEPRKRSWTRLAVTSDAGSDVIEMQEPVDWRAGDRLFVTSSTENYQQQEDVTVVERLSPTRIRVTPPFVYAHRHQIFEGSKYDHSDADLSAAVGLETRNVKIQGAGTDVTYASQLFGGHTMAMNGAIYQLENAEVRRAGQAGVLGRYATHTHMAGSQARYHYVKSLAVHDSNQRCATIHGSKYYTVFSIACTRVRGHSVFVEDGAEEWNVIDENLVAGTTRIFNGLKGDLKPASFWAASATQLWRNNYAAGSINDGYWHELPSHPHGPSFSMNICPTHGHLGQFHNNTAAANLVQGLRIYPSYIPWKNPCDWHQGPPDEYQTYTNLTSFRNGVHGVFNKVGGAIRLKNFKLMGNGFDDERRLKLKDVYGPPLHQPNSEGSLYVRDPDEPDVPGPSYEAKVGLFAPQDEFYFGKDLTFVGYGEGGAIAGCAKCNSQTNLKQGGYTFRFSGLRFFQSTKRIRFTAPYKQIFQDDDGSLTGTAGGWATGYRAFNVWPGQCERQGLEFDNGIVCDDTVKVRRLIVDGFHPEALDDQILALTVRRGTNEEAWDVQQFEPKEFYGWASPVVSTKHYDASVRLWDNSAPFGVDFDWVRLRYSDPAYVSEDENEWVSLSLNRTYYAHRFDVRMVFDEDDQTVSADDSNYLQQDETKNDYNQDRSKYWKRPAIGSWDGNPFNEDRLPVPTDDMGTGWYNQSSNRWYVMLNNRNVTESTPSHNDAHGPWNPHQKTKHRIEGKAMQCPPEGCRAPGAVLVEGEELWSVYFEGNSTRDNLVVPSSLRVIYDLTESPVYRSVRVEGEVVFLNDGASRVLHCEHLLIFGRVFVGTEDAPWQAGSNAEIRLHSLRGEVDDGAVVSNDIYLDDKVIFVGGELLMHGQRRAQAWVRLASTAEAGDSTIQLDRPTDIAPGDQLTITPTEWPSEGSDPVQTEEVTVDSVSDDGTTVTLTAPLKFRHFAGPVDAGVQGTVKLRAAVGILTRNVKISGNMQAVEANESKDTFGGHMVVSEMMGGADSVTGQRARFQGRLVLDSVELSDLGQGGMEHSAILLQFAPWRTGNSDNPLQRITGCSMRNTHNYGIVGKGARNLVIEDNVMARIVNGGIDLDDKSSNATIQRNLVSGMFKSATESSRWTRNRAAFFLDVEPRALRDNVAGGVFDTGFTVRPTQCADPFTRVSDAEDSIRGNEAFGGKIGFFVLSTTGQYQDKCLQLQDSLAWKHAHIGVLTVDQLAHFRLDNVTVADSHIGFSPNYRRGGSMRTSYTVVEGSRFIGMSAASTCDASIDCRASAESDGWGTRCNSVLGGDFMRAGIMTAQYTNRGKTCTHDDEMPVCRPVNTPTRMCGMPWEKRYGLPSTRHAEYHVLDSSFVSFGEGSTACGGRNYSTKAVVSNPTQVDFFPPMVFRGIDWTDTTHDAKFHFFKRSGWTKKKCIDEACDSFGQVFVTDADGTTVSSGRAGAHILSGWEPGHAVGSPACEGVAEWRGIECGTGALRPGSSTRTYLKMVPSSFDNLDRDRGFRLIGPVQVNRESAPALEMRNTSAVGPIANPCPLRFPFSQYPHILETGVVNRVQFGGTLPGTLRAGYFSSDPNDASMVKLFTQRPNSIEVFYNGRLVPPTEGTTLPTLDDPAGTNKFDPQDRHLWVVMRGGDPGAEYLIRRKSSVQLDLTLAVSVDDFAGENVVQNLATLLSIPADRIKIVGVQAGSARVAVEILDESESSLDQQDTVQQVGRLVAVGASIRQALVAGELDLGYPVEDAEIGISRPALEPPPADEAMTSERGTVLPPAAPEVDALLQSVMSNGFTDLAAPAVPLFAGENITYNNVTIEGYVDTNVDDVSATVGVSVPVAADAPPVAGRNTTNRLIVPPSSPTASGSSSSSADTFPVGLVAGISAGIAVAVCSTIAIVYLVRRQGACGASTVPGDPKSSKVETKSTFVDNGSPAKLRSVQPTAALPATGAGGVVPGVTAARRSVEPPSLGIGHGTTAGAPATEGLEFHGENPDWRDRARIIAGELAGRTRGASDPPTREVSGGGAGDGAQTPGLHASGTKRTQHRHVGRAAPAPVRTRDGPGHGASGKRPKWRM